MGIAGVAAPAAAAMLLGGWIDGPWLWVLAGSLAVAAGIGTFACLSPIGHGRVSFGSIILPCVAALAGLGVVRLGGVTPLVVLGAAAGATAVAIAVWAEREVLVQGLAAVRPRGRLTLDALPGERPQLYAAAMLVAFIAFLGALGLAGPASVARLPVGGAPGTTGADPLLIFLVASASVAAVIGYRVPSAVRPQHGDAAWSAATAAALVWATALLLRASDVPVLGWAGVLTAALYLWHAAHRMLERLERVSRRFLDIVILTVLAVVALAGRAAAG